MFYLQFKTYNYFRHKLIFLQSNYLCQTSWSEVMLTEIKGGVTLVTDFKNQKKRIN